MLKGSKSQSNLVNQTAHSTHRAAIPHPAQEEDDEMIPRQNNPRKHPESRQTHHDEDNSSRGQDFVRTFELNQGQEIELKDPEEGKDFNVAYNRLVEKICKEQGANNLLVSPRDAASRGKSARLALQQREFNERQKQE